MVLNMSKFGFITLLSGVAALTLSACTFAPTPLHRLKDGQYWQRSNATSAIYQHGPKAQQMLQRDIARCTTEVRELERLGLLRHNVRGDTIPPGHVPDPARPEGSLAQWETPRRDGYLHAELFDYHDFESCMIYAGWERVEYLPYRTALRSRHDYIEGVLQDSYRSKTGDRARATPRRGGDFDHLNE